MQWFRLAQMLHCTVEEALERVSSLEFTYWKRVYDTEPWGYGLHSWAASMVAATIANVAPRKPGAKALKASDFLPKRARRKRISQRQEEELRQRRGKRRNSNS